MEYSTKICSTLLFIIIVIIITIIIIIITFKGLIFCWIFQQKMPTLNAVPSATETVTKAGSYPVLSFPEKNWCLVSLCGSIIKIKKTNKKNKATNINWKTSISLSWLNFSPLQELRGCGIFCRLLRYQSNMGRHLALPGVIVDTECPMCYNNSDSLFTVLMKSCFLFDELASTNQQIS